MNNWKKKSRLPFFPCSDVQTYCQQACPAPLCSAQPSNFAPPAAWPYRGCGGPEYCRCSTRRAAWGICCSSFRLDREDPRQTDRSCRWTSRRLGHVFSFVSLCSCCWSLLPFLSLLDLPSLGLLRFPACLGADCRSVSPPLCAPHWQSGWLIDRRTDSGSLPRGAALFYFELPSRNARSLSLPERSRPLTRLIGSPDCVFVGRR